MASYSLSKDQGLKTMKKTRKNSTYPIDNETREQILKLVSDKYDEETEE